MEKSWGFPVGAALAAPGDAFGAVNGDGTLDSVDYVACRHFSDSGAGFEVAAPVDAFEFTQKELTQ